MKKIVLLFSLCLTVGMHAERIKPLPFADMESWTVRYIKESKLLGGNTKTLYCLAPQDTIWSNRAYTYGRNGNPWSTSNAYANVIGIEKAAGTMTPEKREDGGTCCRLDVDLGGVQVLGMIDVQVLVAGTLFTGRNIEPITTASDPYQNIDFGMTAQAFAGGSGDYTVEFEPVASTLQENGTGHIVASLGEASGYIPYTVYMASDAFLQENPEAVEAFTRAIYRGQQWVADHSAAEIAKVIQPQFPESDIDTLTAIIDRYKSQDTWKEDPLISEEGFTLMQGIMEQGGELSAPVPFDKLVDSTFAEKVITK